MAKEARWLTSSTAHRPRREDRVLIDVAGEVSSYFGVRVWGRAFAQPHPLPCPFASPPLTSFAVERSQPGGSCLPPDFVPLSLTGRHISVVWNANGAGYVVSGHAVAPERPDVTSGPRAVRRASDTLLAVAAAMRRAPA